MDSEAKGRDKTEIERPSKGITVWYVVERRPGKERGGADDPGTRSNKA